MSNPSNSDPGLGSDGWSSPLDDLLPPSFAVPYSPQIGAPIQPAETRMGTPGRDVASWPGGQNYADTCAIRCQEFILEQFTGVDFDEAALVRVAMDAGWYQPGGGTAPHDVGNLLELHGIAVNRYEGASIFNLTNELAQGHKVIVGVDSGELWGENPILEWIEDRLGISGADHAVVVSGIDTTDPNNVQVIISDPGTGDPAAVYPLERFVDAWRDSNCFMVATQEPAPPYLPEMVNFDYIAGHIPMVWGMPYDHFLGLADQPDSWDGALDAALRMLGLEPLMSLAAWNRDERLDDDQASADMAAAGGYGLDGTAHETSEDFADQGENDGSIA